MLNKINLKYLFREEILKKIDSKLFLLTLFVIIACGFIIRLKVFVFNNSFTLDETSLALNVMEKNYLELFSPLKFGQVTPPFFLLISKFMLNISGASNDIIARDIVLRIFPFICSILSLPLFCLLSHKMFNNRYLTIISTTIFAFNHVAISYTGEFKQYSLELLVSVILLLTFYSTDIKKNSNYLLAFYSLIFCLAPWFSLSSLFILLCGFIVLVIDTIKNSDTFKKSLIIFLPFAINFLIYLFWLIPVKKASYSYMETYWMGTNFFTFQNFSSVFIENSQRFIEFYYPELLIIFVLLSIVILLSCKNYRKIILVLLPPILCIIASFLNLYPYCNRLILFLLPCFAIIYSQFSLSIKNDRLVLILLIIIMMHTSMQLPRSGAISYIMHKSYARNMFLKIKQNEYPDILLATTGIYTYYASIYQLEKESDNLFENFDKEKMDKKLEEFPLNRIGYVFMPYYDDGYDKFKKVRWYMFSQNNKRIKILGVLYSPYVPKEKSEYLIKFVKLK